AFAEIIQAANLPKGVVNIVTGFGEEAGAPLASHPGVDKIAFTGSTEVGKKIMQLAAPTMKRVTLECGGKSANIVFEDADLEMAVDGSLFAMFFNSGQCCTAGSRLFLQNSIYESFVQKFLAKAKQMTLGNPMDKETDLGPLVSKKQQDRVLHYIDIGKKEGAHCLLDGSLSQTGGTTSETLGKACFVGPTIFTQVDNQMKIAQEEIFGPVLCVIPFKSEEEVISLANKSDFGLSAGVWSQDEEKALRVAKRLRSGTVWVNEYHLISEKAPFGGFKQSGLGRELGMEGLKAYTEVKHIHLDQLKSRDKKFWYDSVLAPKVKI
ncbi:MAG: aldehyde dehydrogenase family protein, partial [Cyanobacteria bacterium]|nr:aldehyde dehydrogenase family protein [Cyanobacteriota bacterium]